MRVGEHLRALVTDSDGDVDLRHGAGGKGEQSDGDEQRGQETAGHEMMLPFGGVSAPIGSDGRLHERNPAGARGCDFC